MLESLRPCSDGAGIGRLSVIGRTAVLPGNKSMSNIRSDTEDADPDVSRQSFGGDADASVLRRRNDRTIHSGHFMLSHVHDDSSPAESSREDVIDDDSDDDIAPAAVAAAAAAGMSVVCQTADCGLELGPVSKIASHWAIDPSLMKLFECMTLAYRFDWTLVQFMFRLNVGFKPK